MTIKHLGFYDPQYLTLLNLGANISHTRTKSINDHLASCLMETYDDGTPSTKVIIQDHQTFGKDPKSSITITSSPNQDDAPNQHQGGSSIVESPEQPIVVKKLDFHDEESNFHSSPAKEVITTKQKEALKRYFSTMIDDYPEIMLKLVSQREKAKRMRRHADAALAESDKLLFEAFKYYDDEPNYNVKDLANN